MRGIPRIPYADPDTITDPEIRESPERARSEGNAKTREPGHSNPHRFTEREKVALRKCLRLELGDRER